MSNAKRYDPYRNFKFRIKWEGLDTRYVAALSKCSALKKTTETVEWWEGGDASSKRVLPGKTSYEAITLEAGITEQDSEFEKWANLVNNYQTSKSMPVGEIRKDITIDVCDLDGEKVLSYNVYECWVSEYQALPELDSSGSAVMIRTIKLENEGWEKAVEKG